MTTPVIHNVDADQFSMAQIVNLTCPYSNKRLKEPIIAECCVQKHPRSCANKEAIEEFLSKRNKRGKLNCPHCKANIYGQVFVRQYEIVEILSNTNDTISKVFFKDNHYYADEGCLTSIITTISFCPDLAEKIHFKMEPKIDPFPDNSVHCHTFTSNVNKGADNKKESVADLKRKGGIFDTEDDKQLKKIKIDDKIITQRVVKHKRTAQKNNFDESDIHLRDFWTIVREMFQTRFGTLVKTSDC